MGLSAGAVDILLYITVFSPVGALAVNGVVQIVLVRLSQGAHFFRSIAGGFVAGAVVLAVVEGFLVTQQNVSADAIVKFILVNPLAYSALSYCYFNFVNLGQTSIRIRIYAEIAAARDGASIQDIARHYDEAELIGARLGRLIESGDVIERSGEYFVGRKRLVRAARVIFAAKHLILGKKSEFH